MVQVTIHVKAVGLADKDSKEGDFSDPFFSVRHKGKKLATSETIKDDLSPVFAPLSFELPENFEAGDKFLVVLKDEDTFIDSNLGRVEVPYPITPAVYELKPLGSLHILNSSGQVSSMFLCCKPKKEKKSFFSRFKKEKTVKEKIEDAVDAVKDDIHDATHTTKAEEVEEKIEKALDKVGIDLSPTKKE